MSNTYKTVQGDMWDGIAKKLYGNERYMNDLLEANPSLGKIVVFGAGSVLNVPDIATDEKVNLPPWKR